MQQRIFLWWEHDKGLCEKLSPVLQLDPRAAVANCSFPAESASWKGRFFLLQVLQFPLHPKPLKAIRSELTRLTFFHRSYAHLTNDNAPLFLASYPVTHQNAVMQYFVFGAATWLNELKHSIRVGIHVSNLHVSFVTTTAALNLKNTAVFPTWHAVFSPLQTSPPQLGGD